MSAKSSPVAPDESNVIRNAITYAWQNCSRRTFQMIKGKYRYEKSKPARKLIIPKYKPENDDEEEVIDNIE